MKEQYCQLQPQTVLHNESDIIYLAFNFPPKMAKVNLRSTISSKAQVLKKLWTSQRVLSILSYPFLLKFNKKCNQVLSSFV